jgi:S1-C subfamily serine protease
MRRKRPAALLIAAIGLAAIAVVGCGRVAETLERITEVTTPYGRAPIVTVDPPDTSLASNAVVGDAAHSVVKVRGTAHSCQKILEGSGFVVAPNRVMSNAHVVAGGDTFSVSVDGQEYDATVVVFDPNADISILEVPGLQAPPLEFVLDAAPTDTDAVVMGYHGGGPFVAKPARIREVIELNGPDIYRTTAVSREVYTIRGKVGQGDSGGPLIDRSGRVLGMNFGAAFDDPDTGFVLTAAQIYPHVIGSDVSQPVATGQCLT